MKPRSDAYYMKQALYWAQKAAACGDVPIGAVLVRDGRILSHGYNLRERQNDVTAHAEIVALRSAARKLGTWRLDDCTLYVTLEPCFMCASAIQQSRIAKVCYGASDPKAGALQSIARFYTDFPLNHRVEYCAGILEEECQTMLRDFFRLRRQQNKALESLVGGRGARRRLKKSPDLK